MLRRGLALCHGTTLVQKLFRDYTEELMAYQRHINLHQKYNYLLGQVGNADETPILF
jgi:hypothetical protein